MLASRSAATVHLEREWLPIDTGQTHVHKTSLSAESVSMQTPLFDDEACQQRIGLTVNGELYAEIRHDMLALADYVAAHGDPAAELREMYDAPHAA